MKTCIKCGYTRQPDDTAPEWQCPSCEVAYAKAEKAIELDKKKASLLAQEQLEEIREAKKAKLKAEREAKSQAERESRKSTEANSAAKEPELVMTAKPLKKPISMGAIIAIIAVIVFMIWFTSGSGGTVNPISLGMLVVLFMGLGVIAAYLLPSLIAIGRKHNASISIFILNLLLGWTVLFWIIALVWSLSGDTDQEQVIIIKK